MTALCEAAKADCDQLIEEFEILNNQMKRSRENGS